MPIWSWRLGGGLLQLVWDYVEDLDGFESVSGVFLEIFNLELTEGVLNVDFPPVESMFLHLRGCLIFPAFFEFDLFVDQFGSFAQKIL